MDNNANIDLIRSHVDTIVLRSLLNEDKYGLEILNEIKDKSEGLFTLKQATLYSCLKRLEKQGYIRSYKGAMSNGAQRVYYSLEELGKNFVLNDQYQWEYSRTILNNLLSSKDYDPNSTPPFDASALRPMTRRQPQMKAPTMPKIVDDEPMDSIEDDLDSPTQPYPAQSSEYSYQPHTQPIQEMPSPKHERTFQSAFNFDDKDNSSYSRQEPPIYATVEKLDQPSVNYISSFESIYNNSGNTVVEPTKTPEYTTSEENFDYLSVSELKNKFAREGYTIRPYIKKNTTQYYAGKYYHPNKLLLTTSLIMFAILLVEILSIHFGLHLTNSPALIGVIFASMIFPAFAGIKIAIDPHKRSLAQFNLKTSLINSLIFIINMIIIILIVGHLGFKANFEDISTMVKPIFIPLGMLLNIPLAIVIYDLLFRSKYFHIN